MVSNGLSETFSTDVDIVNSNINVDMKISQGVIRHQLRLMIQAFPAVDAMKCLCGKRKKFCQVTRV